MAKEYSTHNSATFYYRDVGSSSVYLSTSSRGVNDEVGGGWYFDERACTEAAHFFAGLAKGLRAKKVKSKSKGAKNGA